MHDLQLTSKLLQSLFPLASSTFVGKVKARTRPTRPKLMPVSVAWRASLGALLLLPVWDASPSQGFPPAVSRRYPFIHLGEEVWGNNATGEAWTPDLQIQSSRCYPLGHTRLHLPLSWLVLWRNSLYRAVGFFCSVNHLSGPLRKYMFTCSSSKGHGLWFVICGFRTVLFVSCFRARRFVIVLFRAIID